MEKLQTALATVLKKLGIIGAALAAERRIVKHLHTVWERAKKKEEHYGKQADEQRKKAREAPAHSAERKRHKEAAARFDVKAQKQHRKAEGAKLRAQPHIAEIKRLAARVHDLEVDEAHIRLDLKRLQDDSGVTFNGNKASGGTRRQRIKAVALRSAAECAAGRRPNFYSQAGAWDIDHCITGEQRGDRSDCSSWFTSAYRSAQLADPNGNQFRGGFTGTLLTHGKAISRGSLKPGDAVIYGSGTGFHVEMFVGPSSKTIGHGSAPVDPGIVDLVPGAQQRYRSYIN